MGTIVPFKQYGLAMLLLVKLISCKQLIKGVNLITQSPSWKNDRHLPYTCDPFTVHIYSQPNN